MTTASYELFYPVYADRNLIGCSLIGYLSANSSHDEQKVFWESVQEAGVDFHIYELELRYVLANVRTLRRDITISISFLGYNYNYSLFDNTLVEKFIASYVASNTGLKISAGGIMQVATELLPLAQTFMQVFPGVSATYNKTIEFIGIVKIRKDELFLEHMSCSLFQHGSKYKNIKIYPSKVDCRKLSKLLTRNRWNNQIILMIPDIYARGLITKYLLLFNKFNVIFDIKITGGGLNYKWLFAILNESEDHRISFGYRKYLDSFFKYLYTYAMRNNDCVDVSCDDWFKKVTKMIKE